jgi:hypothetical protein
MILLALSAVTAAILVVPSMASAAGWDIDPTPTEAKPLTFTTSGGEAKLTSAQTVTCAANTGSGKYTTATTGKVSLKFTGCKGPFFTTCTTAGQASGTIVTTELEFHNIMIENTVQLVGGTPGILITPNGGHFASFTCSVIGININIAVSGNGIIGDISSPKCAGSSKTATLNFESSATGVQKFMQEETAGTKYDLTSSENGGAPATASEDATGTITFGETATITCP